MRVTKFFKAIFIALVFTASCAFSGSAQPPTPTPKPKVDDEIIKLRDLEEVSALLVTHQLRDAFYVASHEAVREGDAVKCVPASPKKVAETSIVMLKDSRVLFEGTLPELRASADPYLQSFLS